MGKLFIEKAKENGSNERPTSSICTVSIKTALLLLCVCLELSTNVAGMCWLCNSENPECKPMSFMISIILKTKFYYGKGKEIHRSVNSGFISEYCHAFCFNAYFTIYPESFFKVFSLKIVI